MCAQRILRSGPTSDVVKSRLMRREDAKQGAFDLEAPPCETRAEQTIYRLAHEVAELRLRLARAGLALDAEGITYRAYNSKRGWSETVDPVARMARGFASRLADVKCIRTLDAAGRPGEHDARAVNAQIAMIAEEADSLITALIEDAEACGLEASGDWMRIPLIECRKFEVVTPDPALEEADDLHDRKLNS